MGITLRHADMDVTVQLPRDRYLEGSVIEAQVQATADRDLAVQGGEVELVRTVTYRYRQWSPYGGSSTAPTRRSDVVSREPIRIAEYLTTGQSLMRNLRLAVPSTGPGSVSAELVQIQWFVFARVHLSDAADVNGGCEILVLSRSQDCASVALAPPVAVDRDFAALDLDIQSGRRLVPGAELSGSVTVTPRRAGSARALRLELVLQENVEHGPWLGDDPARNPSDQGKRAETVVDCVQLAGQHELERGNPRSYPFTLPVPPQLPAPSMHTPEFSLRWLLRAVLDRPLHKDPYVEVELHGLTSPD